MTVIIIITVAAAVICLFQSSWRKRMTVTDLKETAAENDSGEAGMYHLYSFRISGNGIDAGEAARVNEQKEKLALIEINLVNYRKGPVDEGGLDEIDSLFKNLTASGRKLIVRFLYDWDGTAWKYEPDDLSVVLNHMNQMSGILHAYEDHIMIMQGLWIGNWGEMNGSRFNSEEDLKQLAVKLLASTGEKTFLAVRTPAQLRRLKADGVDVSRFTIFNDGLFGSETDLGTYGTSDHSAYTASWTRDKEFSFLDQLGRTCPIGGEAVGTAKESDFENALAQMEKNHISYLNADYDQDTLNKWKNFVIKDGSVYEGMNGYDYVRLHLGSRYVFFNTSVHYSWFTRRLKIQIQLKNEGFSPYYGNIKVLLKLAGEDGRVSYFPFEGFDSTLCKGDQPVSLSAGISFHQMKDETYDLYVVIENESGEIIKTANNNTDSNGTKIGMISSGK